MKHRAGEVRGAVIRENQRFLNQLNVVSDVLLICLMMPLAYWLRFDVLHGVENVPRESYLRLGLVIMALEMFFYAARGIYQTSRVLRIRREVINLLEVNLLLAVLLLGWLYLNHSEHYSRLLLVIFFTLSINIGSTATFILYPTAMPVILY